MCIHDPNAYLCRFVFVCSLNEFTEWEKGFNTKMSFRFGISAVIASMCVCERVFWATIADNVWLSSNYQMIMAFYHFHLVIIIRKIRCF